MRLWQASVRFTEPHTILASSRAVLPASLRHRLIDLTPAADKFLLRPCHAVFAIFRPPHQTAVAQSHRILAALMTLCRHFDDAPIVARPASIMKTSARKLNHQLENTTARACILALIGEKSSLQ
jgi:hypothetical protein